MFSGDEMLENVQWRCSKMFSGDEMLENVGHQRMQDMRRDVRKVSRSSRNLSQTGGGVRL